MEECGKIGPRKGAKYLRDLVKIALYSGMRQSEIFGLRRINVHLEENYILATNTKTRQDRPVPNRTVEPFIKRVQECQKGGRSHQVGGKRL